MFPVVGVRWMNGYEAEKQFLGAADPHIPRLVGAWGGIRVKNWSSRPVEVSFRGVVMGRWDYRPVRGG
jgi:hypothetical protein